MPREMHPAGSIRVISREALTVAEVLALSLALSNEGGGVDPMGMGSAGGRGSRFLA